MTSDPTPWLLTLQPPDGSPPAPNRPDALPPDTLGLSLSGGGVRSATFALGVLQALAKSGWLRHVDYLSTVSGGGYAGAFLGRFFDQCGKRDGLTGAVPDVTPGAAQVRVARDLADPRSEPIAWLRRHANYLAPGGHGEAVSNVAAFARNLLSVYVVLGTFLFAAFGLLNALAYWHPSGAVAAALYDAVAAVTPLTDLLMGHAGLWGVAAELILWLAVVPLMLAYWLAAQDLPEAFLASVLVSAALCAGAILLATMSPLGLVALALAVAWVLTAWAAVRRDEGHRDPFHPARLALARNHLTRWLAVALAAAVGLAAAAVVDWLGGWLAARLLAGGLTPPNVAGWLASVGATVFGLATGLRMLVRLMAGESPGRLALLGTARPYLVAALVLVVGALPPLVAVAFASHLAFENGDAFEQGLAATGMALIVSLLLGRRECVPFVNRSGAMGIYAARLARAFLGAVNPARRTHPEGRNVAHVVPGDDVPLAEYAPHAAGGPLHLINCAVAETVDVASQRGQRDRQAVPLAVGPAGVSVAAGWHALWEGGSGLRPLAAIQEARPHPFLSTDAGPVAVEPLALREWVAISGAAVSPANGRRTSTGRALLLTLANVRLGHWWDSGLNAGDRANIPGRRGVGRRLLTLFATIFRAQSLLLAELAGRFAGPWERYWQLTDGGHFETTGAYELLRRRLPFVIACEAGEDLDGRGAGLANLIRLARIDLGAEVVEVPLPDAVPAEVAAKLGTLASVTRSTGTPAAAHASLLLVRYPGDPGHDDAFAARTHTWLLYVRACLTGDEPADVRGYAADHPAFPDEPTLDQIFDEPQWESYRKLGEHTAEGLFR